MRKSVRGRAIGTSLVLAMIVAAILVGVRIRDDTGNRPSGVPASFAGLWTGTVAQANPPNPANSTTVSIILTARSSTGGIGYGDDLCSGTLRVTAAGPATVSFTQSLSYNPGRVCTANGIVTLSRPTAATVDFHQSGPASTTGVLHRQ